MTVPQRPAGPLIRIGQLARRSGVSVRALRYYEQQGLLRPTRSPSGQRLYPPDAVERARLFRRMYAAGLTSRTIVHLLPSLESGRTDVDQHAVLRAERDRIKAKIDDLQAALHHLDQVIATSGPNGAGLDPDRATRTTDLT